VEKTILKATTVRVLKLKKILQNAAPELQKLGSNYSDMARWNSAVKNLNGFQALDDAASHLSIIGLLFGAESSSSRLKQFALPVLY